jgi:AcrR family transcriptional regulator
MKTNRLSPSDWVNAGLRALAKSGFTALKADTLAKALGVSRGSFYWHFADVDAFHHAVLDAWEKVATGDIIAQVESKGGNAAAQLHTLAEIVFAQTGTLDRQVRAWASQSAAAATVQARVDERRSGFTADLFGAAGFGKAEAHLRAAFLYRAVIGQFAMGKGARLSAGEAQTMVDLLLAPQRK